MQDSRRRPVLAGVPKFLRRLIVASYQDRGMIDRLQYVNRDTQIAPRITEVTRANDDIEIRCTAREGFRRSGVGVEVAEEKKLERRACHLEDIHAAKGRVTEAKYNNELRYYT